ncbi:MAG: transaldolase [Gammaproteobacteria bacterium]|nr:transaldolase [Gammaproteobacteria bacterium]
MTKLEALRNMTQVVADTGDIEAIAEHHPVDATTNPSLLYKAAQLPQYKHLVDDAVEYGIARNNDAAEQSRLMMDRLAVNFGVEILKIIPGRVSTEVDARLSFDTEATIARAMQLMGLYDAAGISKDRVLIKIASTWEGIRAAEVLEREGIHSNLTLMFGFPQAVACADAGVTLISPFVGRISDWFKKVEGVDGYSPEDDPGVRSVTRIYNYYKRHGYKTTVMGASFRNSEQILQLAGCDLLTISPHLMEQLDQVSGEVPRQLEPQAATYIGEDRVHMGEKDFRWSMNDDAMATEKLAEGIRGFAADASKLAQFAFEACASCGKAA